MEICVGDGRNGGGESRGDGGSTKGSRVIGVNGYGMRALLIDAYGQRRGYLRMSRTSPPYILVFRTSNGRVLRCLNLMG